jgi:hypothetical protein
LPDELDPQVREFAGQLRRLVDRSGLSLSGVADRTGYSKTSWERYLNGRLLAPKGAIVALAEVTGTNPVHLTTMWELAERAWSRAELRQDQTVEALRISQARTALGEFGPPQNEAWAGGGGRVAVTPGVAGPAGVSPTIPRQPTGREEEEPPSGGRGGRRLTTFLAGVTGVVVVTVGAFLLTTSGSDTKSTAATRPSSPSAGPSTVLPAGVKCAGAGCDGKDAETMGCSGDLVTTADSATVGTTLVEVRYSKTCGAAWGRITQAGPGDAVQVFAGARTQQDGITVSGDTIAYTPMVAVRSAGEARACVTLASGAKGCTS